MGRHRERNRILGPYPFRSGWRYVEIINGHREYLPCSGCQTAEEAEKHVDAVRAALDAPNIDTVEEAVMEYVRATKKRTGRDETAEFVAAAMRPLTHVAGQKPVGNLTAADLEAALEHTASLAMATRRSYYRATVQALTWMYKRGLIHRDVPAEFDKSRGRRDERLPWETSVGAKALNRGKLQLRNQSEAQAYLLAALNLTVADNTPKDERDRMTAERRVAASLPLLCGLRSGEVLYLRVGDIDLRTRTGYIRDCDRNDGWSVKTAASQGTFDIPATLVDYLKTLTEKRNPDAYLIIQDGSTDLRKGAKGEPRGRHWLADIVAIACRNANAAGAAVRVVTPHGLRGTHASLLRDLMKLRVGDIAEALRHGDGGKVATQHYIGVSENRPALTLVEADSAKKKRAAG